MYPGEKIWWDDMSFERVDASALDYDLCRYGASRLHFRGPKPSLSEPYVAFLGGTETFGRCVRAPFPALLETATGSVCLNLGQSNAGIDAFVSDPEVPHLASGAKMVIVQVMSAIHMSNRFYRVHPRRNDRFLDASAMLASVFREVDFTEFAFNRHMLRTLQTISPDRYRLVENELRIAWSARMRLLLRGIDKPCVLLWVHVDTQDPLGPDPVLVSRDMVHELSDMSNALVEVSVQPSEVADDMDGMVVADTERPAAARLIGPAAHAEIAAALAPHFD